MLVDVIELRVRGQKRSKDQVRALTPVRGILTLDSKFPVWNSGRRDWNLQASLRIPDQSEWALEPLEDARVVAIKQGSLLVIGTQYLCEMRRYVDYPQAWWCRVAGGVTARDLRNAID